MYDDILAQSLFALAVGCTVVQPLLFEFSSNGSGKYFKRESKDAKILSFVVATITLWVRCYPLLASAQYELPQTLKIIMGVDLLWSNLGFTAIYFQNRSVRSERKYEEKAEVTELEAFQPLDSESVVAEVEEVEQELATNVKHPLYMRCQLMHAFVFATVFYDMVAAFSACLSYYAIQELEIHLAASTTMLYKAIVPMIAGSIISGFLTGVFLLDYNQERRNKKSAITLSLGVCILSFLLHMMSDFLVIENHDDPLFNRNFIKHALSGIAVFGSCGTVTSFLALCMSLSRLFLLKTNEEFERAPAPGVKHADKALVKITNVSSGRFYDEGAETLLPRMQI